MTNYETNREAFEKLFTVEELSGGVEKLLPWRYEVSFYYPNAGALLSGSTMYYSSETGLLDQAIVRWYHDNSDVGGDVSEVTLTLNSSWKKNDYQFYA